jgi:hypothetical protein
MIIEELSMNPHCSPAEHLDRRAFLKGTLASASGLAVANWGGLFNSQTIAAEARKQGKHCILLWMAGGVSHMDTFDMKPGQPQQGPFRPIASRVTGIQMCEYLPQIARQADKLAIIRSMKTPQGDHPGATYVMHTGYRKEPTVQHPEIGSMIAKYLGPDLDLPHFIQIGAGGGESSPAFGSGYLGPAYQPFHLSGMDSGMPANTTPYVSADAQRRRSDLLQFVEEGFARQQEDTGPGALRAAQERSERLLKAKGVFNINDEWARYRDRYGDTAFGKNCLMARRLIEAGVAFVEVVHGNYDTHGDNFEGHKALLPTMDCGWAGLLQDLQDRGLLQDTLVVWMGEVGRTPVINNRAGRDHWIQAWTVVLAGGGVRGGLHYGQSDPEAKEVADKPVTEGDLFATIYTTLGIKPTVKHYVGSRPIRATAEHSKVINEILV